MQVYALRESGDLSVIHPHRGADATIGISSFPGRPLSNIAQWRFGNSDSIDSYEP
jgi:hypothetical protein